MAGKSAVVLVSEGSEEMEFVISADVLRRGGVSFKIPTGFSYQLLIANPISSP